MEDVTRTYDFFYQQFMIAFLSSEVKKFLFFIFFVFFKLSFKLSNSSEQE